MCWDHRANNTQHRCLSFSAERGWLHIFPRSCWTLSDPSNKNGGELIPRAFIKPNDHDTLVLCICFFFSRCPRCVNLQLRSRICPFMHPDLSNKFGYRISYEMKWAHIPLCVNVNYDIWLFAVRFIELLKTGHPPPPGRVFFFEWLTNFGPRSPPNLTPCWFSDCLLLSIY